MLTSQKTHLNVVLCGMRLFLSQLMKNQGCVNGVVHWADGTIFDLEKIREKTNKVGAMLIIDGTQSIGTMPFDLKKVKPDALICAAYKWLMGPYGFGVAYYGNNYLWTAYRRKLDKQKKTG